MNQRKIEKLGRDSRSVPSKDGRELPGHGRSVGRSDPEGDEGPHIPEGLIPDLRLKPEVLVGRMKKVDTKFGSLLRVLFDHFVITIPHHPCISLLLELSYAQREGGFQK